jgi:hypothetical protein
MSSNGRLAASALGDIPGGRLEKSAAHSWLRLRAKIGRETGIWICPTSSRTAYRTYAEQQYFWQLYTSGRGNLAARPGTSNHGWGLAVDVPSVAMASAINRYGASYGWQKRWSDAPSEWWHFKYAPQFDNHQGESPQTKPQHPYHVLTEFEKKWRNVLVRERRIAKHKGGWSKVGADHLTQAKRAKGFLRDDIRRIEQAAKKGGWSRANRRTRHDYLKRLVNG